jgi:hypothetical protein
MHRSLALPTLAGICLLSPIFARGEDLPHPAPVISFAMPEEVDAPVDPDENAIAVFDDFSWREFIAIKTPPPKWFGRRGRLITSCFKNKEQSLRNGLRSMGSPLVMIWHSKVQATRKSLAPFRSSRISIRSAMDIPEDR